MTSHSKNKKRKILHNLMSVLSRLYCRVKIWLGFSAIHVNRKLSFRFQELWERDCGFVELSAISSVYVCFYPFPLTSHWIITLFSFCFYSSIFWKQLCYLLKFTHLKYTIQWFLYIYKLCNHHSLFLNQPFFPPNSVCLFPTLSCYYFWCWGLNPELCTC